MILYRLAKWMEEQERSADRCSSSQSSSNRVSDRTELSEEELEFHDHFPLMKQEVERFREQVPYLTYGPG